MSAISVGTTPVKLSAAVGRAKVIIQNLGPGTLYFDLDAAVAPETGIKIPADSGYEFYSSLGDTGDLYLVSSATSDVRYLAVL
jgi:hypothetical protein